MCDSRSCRPAAWRDLSPLGLAGGRAVSFPLELINSGPKPNIA
jgi:hypothetical protein